VKFENECTIMKKYDMLSLVTYNKKFMMNLVITFCQHGKWTIKVTIATLALGWRPKQGLAKVQAKNEAQESYFMLPGVQENVRE
jgi:hypothetical protein